MTDRTTIFGLTLALAAPAFAQSPAPAASPAARTPTAVKHALAVMHPTKDSTARGTIHFQAAEGGVRVHGSISGLAPGTHGFHVHEFGDCSAPDGTSAGGHYNPAGHPHAAPTAAARHAGDMGNVEAAADGTAKVDYLDRTLTLAGEAGIVGRAVIVHAKADDLKTQPTGDAGGRLACGVVGVAK